MAVYVKWLMLSVVPEKDVCVDVKRVIMAFMAV